MQICIAHGGDISQPSGGTDRVTALASGLSENGFDVILVVPEPTNAVPKRLENVEIDPVTPRRLGVSNALIRAERVTQRSREVASQRGATLQLEHSSLAGVGTLGGCTNFVLDMHDVAYPRFDHVDTPIAPVLKRGMAWLEHRAARRAAHIIVVSEFMKRILNDQWDIGTQDITVVPNGYFSDRIRGMQQIDTIPGRVCFLGTLHPKVDLEAFEAIANLSSVSEVLVIGDGAERERLNRLAATHAAIHATGRLPDDEAFRLLASAELVVNPQTSSDLQRSSSPVKLYYYAALGKPMVISHGPSIVDQLVDENAARGGRTRDEFMSHVRQLLDSPSLRDTLSQNAVRVASDFTWDCRNERVRQLYEQRVHQP